MKTLYLSTIAIFIIIMSTFSFQESFAHGINTMGNPVITSPLKQFKSGIAAKDVKCKEGLQIIMKNENGQPACVTAHTFDELITRGWGIIPLGGLPTHQNTASDIVISYNYTLYKDGIFHVTQGQNFTLMLNVTSIPVNVPVTLYTAPHSGFTKTNGIDFKLSDTKVNTPAKVMLYMSVSKDAIPSTYGATVRLNDTDKGSVTYTFRVTVAGSPYQQFTQGAH
ncbi:MAG: hypothetical protein LV477_00290 [Candidatus Nitrosotalea sp.]|nr:hypothetical protein [Candidatus Nitrosotalea sp.]